MRQITTRVDDDLYAAIEEVARQNERSISGELRVALIERGYLGLPAVRRERDPGAPETKTQRPFRPMSKQQSAR